MLHEKGGILVTYVMIYFLWHWLEKLHLDFLHYGHQQNVERDNSNSNNFSPSEPCSGARVGVMSLITGRLNSEDSCVGKEN